MRSGIVITGFFSGFGWSAEVRLMSNVSYLYKIHAHDEIQQKKIKNYIIINKILIKQITELIK